MPLAPKQSHEQTQEDPVRDVPDDDRQPQSGLHLPDQAPGFPRVSGSAAVAGGPPRRLTLLAPTVLTQHIGSNCPACVEAWTRFGQLPSTCATCGADRRELAVKQECRRCGHITVSTGGLKPSSNCMGCGSRLSAPAPTTIHDVLQGRLERLRYMPAPAPAPCEHSWVEEENEADQPQMACEKCGATNPAPPASVCHDPQCIHGYRFSDETHLCEGPWLKPGAFKPPSSAGKCDHDFPTRDGKCVGCQQQVDPPAESRPARVVS